ncbi:hypothetical protein [Paenibacillus sp. FSL H8-0260]|uniref:hypothetical protein n=1 Tax=Paenibacillus sp. FSL H8-0260 TaxID=2921380 RepID=UPI00324A249A
MSSNTPNLNLLKVNPVTDGNDTFNIDTMLNDNWDKIDTTVGNKVDKVSGKQLSTNDYTTAEKTKLSGVATGANNYTHPTGDGNQHVPATGTSNNGKVLKAGTTAGSSSWGNVNGSEVVEDATHRFATDAEKATWNAKETTTGSQAKADAAVLPINNRLNTESLTAINLVAGQQILNATKNARLQGLKVQGRSLINRQINGGFNDSNADGIADSWSPALAGASATVVNGKYSKAQRITSTVNDTLDHRYLVGVNLQLYANKKYIALVDFENDGTTQGAFRFGSPADATSTTNTTMYIKKAPTIDETSYLILFNQKAKGAVGWVQFEGARIYEISDADYAAIGSMSSEQVAQRWPYVPPGINGVDGLYVRRYGRNLLPPFTDKAWSFNPNAKANGPYQSVLTATAEWQAISCAVPVIPGKTYYLSIEGITANSGAVGSYLDSNKKNDLAVLSGGWIQNQPLIVPEGYYYILINLASNQIGTYNFNNPQLELGSVATPFQPREDSLIAFGGVELHANPTDGNEPDILREVNGRYEVTRLWRKSNLVGDWSWLFDTNYTGFKRVRVILPTSSGINASERVTKYNGYPLYPSAGVYSAADQSTLYNGVLYITIANTDSGWGDSYTPTPDEIKAYFNGWRMYNGASGVATNPYNGTAGQTKGWVEILSAGNPVGVLPTTIPSGWIPYQLLYRLATPTTETVQEDGALSLLEGDNFIEVGSGYISREPARPKKNALSDVYYIGLNDAGNGGDSSLKKRASEIKQVFKNSLPDFWNIDKLADGTRYAWTDNYDTATSYSVSYIKLDKSPVPSVSGAYAATEKMQIHDLTDAVTEISSTVSVLAAKKAEKDAGPWITPSAVLSGFTAFDLAYRVNKGFIEFRGYVYYNITDVPAGTKIFNLPTQFRPVRITRMLTSSWTSKVDPTSSAVSVGVNGDITTEVNVKQNIIFDGLRFPLD